MYNPHLKVHEEGRELGLLWMSFGRGVICLMRIRCVCERYRVTDTANEDMQINFNNRAPRCVYRTIFNQNGDRPHELKCSFRHHFSQ